MLYYLLRKLLYSVPILFGVNLITFLLFFLVNSPDDMARTNLGHKHVTQQAIVNWKQQHNYDKPMFYNPTHPTIQAITDTLFWQKSMKLFVFDFGYSDGGRDIRYDILQRMAPSLAIAVPVLIVGLVVHLFIALLLIFFRDTYIELSGLVCCIVMMSISGLFYLLGGQLLIAKYLRLVPVSGYLPGISAIPFIILPIFISVFGGIGSNTRWYRTLFLEEVNQDYVRTARAKGLSEFQVLARHVLRNALIPILTGVVVIIPSLFMGSLILESFFSIPGLGSYVIDAINQQDFAIVRSMVFLGSFLYIIGLLLTDISYVLADPRIRLE
jgi:peptide/nickel transport system permease protein